MKKYNIIVVGMSVFSVLVRCWVGKTQMTHVRAMISINEAHAHTTPNINNSQGAIIFRYA